MNFQTAIRSGFQNYANFKGRASRAEYWWWTLFALIVQIVTSGQNAIGDLFSLAILLPSVAVTIRRLHDTNRRGWWFALPIDGPDKFYWGFPFAFLGEGFHTSMSYQFFILELIADFIIY